MSRRLWNRSNNGELGHGFKHSYVEGQSMNVTSATFGCTGFLGRFVASTTAYHRYTNLMPFRFRSGVGGSIRMVRHVGDGTYGQNFPVDYELDKEFVVKEILDKVDHVFNCVGAWQEPAIYEQSQSWFSMEALNVEWPRMLARWCRELGINRLVHMSMVGADPNSPSKLLRQKGLAEQAVLEEFPRATIIRCTDLFGEDDHKYTRMFRAQRHLKCVPLANHGRRIHQPLFVGDVAEAAVRAINIDHTEGRIAELGGPVRFTTNDFLRWVAECNAQYHYVIPMPKNLFWRPFLWANERCPVRKGAFIGPRVPYWNQDWLDREYIDNVAMPERDPELLDWEDFGICRDDLYRIEEKYFLVAHHYSKENSYIEKGTYM